MYYTLIHKMAFENTQHFLFKHRISVSDCCIISSNSEWRFAFYRMIAIKSVFVSKMMPTGFKMFGPVSS